MASLSLKWSLTSLAILLAMTARDAAGNDYVILPELSESYYAESCPDATATAYNAMKELMDGGSQDLPAGVVRLHFHDCFVRGCDASVLVESTEGNLAEMDSQSNTNSLRGFDVIDKVKSAVEDICPGVVSCADILALASRDSLLISRGLYFPVPLGRRDGVVSTAAEAEANLPNPAMDFDTLVGNFANKGLRLKDMVVLTGAHTIGNAHCTKIWPRLYNFSSTEKTDPSLDPKFAARLKKKCPESKPQNDKNVDLDPTRGGQFFDSQYYKNVLAKKTAFISDSALITDSTGLDLVRTYSADPKMPFFEDFGISMVKMGQIGVLTGNQGVIRRVCSKI